ncbi:beta-d-glucoside glucohydrolase D [Penicillium hispanicum]|uniref:beta-d-glucoside glucohydrolase D n=1 Tax=Penicillium hispanicum TaxID=1080232 RepID=UPI0025411758|nr:beta-d-glucoside glucohydrolase D [Penicillium hispanicum]KAJ5584529.1 beta-d-glucoside glucohydrolase D [Penicillium hispanicum]
MTMGSNGRRLLSLCASLTFAVTGYCASGLLSDLHGQGTVSDQEKSENAMQADLPFCALVDFRDWSDAYDKATAMVAKMSNEDKLLLVTGQDVPSVNYEAIRPSDGSQGMQVYDYATAFLESSAMAQTWDTDLIKEGYRAVGREFNGKGLNFITSPTVNPQGRTPWGGRLVESLGQDTYLAGIIFGLATESFREAGIIPCGKHFLLYEQETNRSQVYWGNNGVTYKHNATTNAYSSNANDKTLHEAYLWPFFDGVKSGLGAVMCAMNRVNGSWACENSALLNDILKSELAFPGFVMPDTSGQHTALGSANSGMDYGATEFWNNDTLIPALANHTLSQKRFDDMAVRNLMPYFHQNMDQKKTRVTAASPDDYVDVRANHREIVRKAGAASISLLKNTRGTLPLKQPRSMSIFGANARPKSIGPGSTFDDVHNHRTWDGHLVYSGGSGMSSPSYIISPYDALTQKGIAHGTQLMWMMEDTASGSYVAVTGTKGTAAAPRFWSYASATETCLVFINAWSGEGNDREELSNADQDKMINEVASNCNNTIVSVTTVGSRLLESWIDHPNVTAVIYSSLLGEQSGQALIDVLYGDVNPSGRLTYTIARNESDYPVPICMTADCDFTEGVYLDYKYFDEHKITPRYEFGYGLSYTSFEYGPCSSRFGYSCKTTPAITYTNETALRLQHAQGPMQPGGQADMWDVVMELCLQITNTGDVDGAEVAQLYVGFPEKAEQPIRQLRGFEKIFLSKSESGTVSFKLRRRDLSYWDVDAQTWVIAKGEYTFWVGGSSRDLRGSTKYHIN